MESKHKKIYRMRQRECKLWENHKKVKVERDAYDPFVQIYIKTKSAMFSFFLFQAEEVYRQALNDRVRIDIAQLHPRPEGARLFSSATVPQYRSVGKSRKRLIEHTVTLTLNEDTPSLFSWRVEHVNMWNELITQYTENGFGHTITSRVTVQEQHKWGNYYKLVVDDLQSKTDEELVDICRKFIADRSSIGTINYGFEEYKRGGR